MRISVGGRALACAGMVPLLLLAACGGGGGGVASTPTPASTASTSTTTTTTTTTVNPLANLRPATTNVGNINYDDAEYRRSNGATSAGMLAAYNAGASGAGVKIALLDAGISDPLGQFTGRIDPASRDVVASRSAATDAGGGHGTSIAGIAASARDGRDVMGVAFGATLLVLRTDTVDSCNQTGGCRHADTNLARAVDLARTGGAKVINLSLGGSAASSTFVTAVRAATAAGVIVVVAAGNAGTANPDAFAQIASDPLVNGMVIIAGSHGATGAASTYSDKAGTFGAFYLTALGEDVRSYDNTGASYVYTGTSYSAPVISGAIAVLAQAFPNLTGKQIVDLLYETATDAGDAGIDPIYGRGLLNVARAMQPIGATALAGSAVAVSTSSNATLGSAMGDAGQAGSGQTGSGASAQAVFLDRYGRAFSLDLARTVGRLPGARPLVGALAGDIRATGLAQGALSLSLNIARNRGLAMVDRLHLNQADARAVRMISGRVMAQVGRRTQAVFGFAEGAGRLSAMLDGRADLPFVAARESDATPGFALRDGHALAVRRDLGFAGMTVAGESGRVDTPLAGRFDHGLYQGMALRFDRPIGAVALSAGLGLLRESDTVLGGRFGGALGGGGATTRLIDLRGDWAIGGGWSLAGALRQGWTRADSGAVLTRGRLSSNAFSVDLGRAGRVDRFGLRIGWAMRVETGGLRLNLPSSYDYASGAVGYAVQTLGLAPKGRELDVEAVYGRALLGGWIDANLFVRRQPGNVASMPANIGTALRYAVRF